MEILKIVLVVIQFALALGLIAIVILQPAKGEGLGSIGGGSKLFFGKKKGYEAVLEKATTWVAVGFMITSFLFIFTK